MFYLCFLNVYKIKKYKQNLYLKSLNIIKRFDIMFIYLKGGECYE
jgi:hypothetical protein